MVFSISICIFELNKQKGIMLIDIDTIREQADELHNAMLALRGEQCFYTFVREDGSQFTSFFTPKELAEFLPKKKASECIAMWEEINQREVDLWEKAIKNKEYPYYTHWIVDEDGNDIEIHQKMYEMDVLSITKNILEPKKKNNQKLYLKQILRH